MPGNDTPESPSELIDARIEELPDWQGFLSSHCFTTYVKVAFFRGASLRPVPPVASKHENVRYVHIHENDEVDEELVASWVRQASELPGWAP